MFKLLPLLAVMCLIFGGCASSVVKVMPEYNQMDVSQSKVGVILLPETIVIQNTADAEDDLGMGDVVVNYRNFFAQEFTRAFKERSKFGSVSFIDNAGSFQLKDTSIAPMQTYLVPSNAGSGSFQYLLICGGVVSRTEWQSTGMGGSTKVLYHALSFLLWDNVNNKVVSYAAFEKNVPTFIVPVMTKDTWLRMMNDLAKVIVSGTPYKKLN